MTRSPREVLAEYDTWHDCLSVDAPITTRDDLATALREALTALAKTSEDTVALAKHYMDERDAARAEAKRYREALEWIARVNAMDYEYVRVARAALAPPTERSEDGSARD